MKVASLHSPLVYRPISAENVQPRAISNRQQTVVGTPVARGVESRSAPAVYQPTNFLQPHPSSAVKLIWSKSNLSSGTGPSVRSKTLATYWQAPSIPGVQLKKTQATRQVGLGATVQRSEHPRESKGEPGSGVAPPSIASAASATAAATAVPVAAVPAAAAPGPMANPLLFAAFAAVHLLSDGAAENASPQPTHFSSGANVAITYTHTGAMQDPEHGGAASVPKRTALYKGLGMGAHVLAGHFLADAALISQARMGKANFRWSSDQALIAAVNKAAFVFRWRIAFFESLADAEDKRVTVNIGPHDGHGFIVGTDGKLYRVAPKYARVIAKSLGDFNTAYGVTEVKDPTRFAEAYYSWVEV